MPPRIVPVVLVERELAEVAMHDRLRAPVATGDRAEQALLV
jgi:hypothetical protein